MSRAANFVIDRPWVPLSAILVALGIWWIYGTRTQDHEVRAAFTTGVQLYSGLDVRVDGIDAGKVTNIEYQDGQAVVGLGIDDDEVWPLHEGTTAVINWGTTVGNGTRYITIEPGPEDAPEIPEGGLIPSDQTISPVEFDDLFNTFNTKTRDRLQAMLGNTGDTIEGNEAEISAALKNTPGAFESVGNVFAQLIEDEAALQQLVADTENTTSILAARTPEIRDLVSGLAATMDEFGRNENDLRIDIEEFPTTLREARTTLARLDTSVGVLDGLVDDIGPGAQKLSDFAVDARPTLSQLRSTIPNALAVFDAFDNHASNITTMAKRLTKTSKDLDPFFADLAPFVSCLRPYAPEIAGFFSNWNSFTKNFDGTGQHFARTRLSIGAHNFADQPPLPTETVIGTFGYTYAFPRPPGIGANNDASTAFFQPDCGIGPEALDPAADPEDDA